MANEDYKSNISDFIANKRTRHTQLPTLGIVNDTAVVDADSAHVDQPTIELLKALLNIDDSKPIEVEELTEKLVKYNEVDSNVGNQLYSVMVDESVADVSDRIERIMNNTEIRANSFIPPVIRLKIRYELVPKYIDRNKNLIETNTIKDFNPMSIIDMLVPRAPQVRVRERDEYKYKLQVCLDILSHSNSDINKDITKYELYKKKFEGTPNLIKKCDDNIRILKASKIRNENIRKAIRDVIIPEIKNYDPSNPIIVPKMSLEKQLEIVNEYPLALGLIPTPNRKTIITAIKKDPQSIYCIPSPNPELQRFAVEVGGPKIIRFIKPGVKDDQINRSKKWTRDPEAIAMACKKDWSIILYLNEWLLSEKIQKIAISKDLNAIKYIEYPTAEVQELILKLRPKLVKYIRTPTPEIKLFAEKYNIKFLNELPEKERFEVNIDYEKYEKMKNKTLIALNTLSIPHLLSNLMLPLSGETVKYKSWSLKPKGELVQPQDLTTNRYISTYISEYRKAFLGEYFKSKKEMPTEFLPIRVSYLFSFKNLSHQQCPAYYIRIFDVRNYLLTQNGFTERIPTENAELKAQFITNYYMNKKNLTSLQAVAKSMGADGNNISYAEALQSMPLFIYDEPTGEALVRKIQNMHGNTGAVVYIYNLSKKQLHTYARMVFTGKGRSAHLQKSDKRSSTTSQSEFAIPINWLLSPLEKSEKLFDSAIYRYFFKAVKSGRLPGSFLKFYITAEVAKTIQAFNSRLEHERNIKQAKKQAIIDKKAEIDAQTHNIDPNKIKLVLRGWFAEDLKWEDNKIIFKLPKVKIEDPRIGPVKEELFNFLKVWGLAGETLKEKINTFKKVFKLNQRMIPKQSIINLYNALSKTKEWSAEMIASLMSLFGFENIATPVEPISTSSTSSDKTSMDSEILEFKRLYDLNTQIRLEDDQLRELNRLMKKYKDVHKELERNAYKANLKQSKNVHERLSSLMTTSNVKMLSLYIKKKLSLNLTSKILYNKITSILSTHVNNIIKLSELPKKKDLKKKLLLDETNKLYEYNTTDKTLTILNLEYSYRDVFNIYSKFKNKTIDITNLSKKNLLKYFNEWLILYLQSIIRKYKKYIDSATIIRFSTLLKKDRYLQYNILFKIQSEINKLIVNKNNRIRKIVYKIVKKISKKSINIDSILYNLNKYLKLNSKKFRNIEI